MMRPAALVVSGDILMRVGYIPSAADPTDAPSRRIKAPRRRTRACTPAVRRTIVKTNSVRRAMCAQEFRSRQEAFEKQFGKTIDE